MTAGSFKLRWLVVLVLALVPLFQIGAYGRSVAGLSLSSATQDDFFTFFRFKEVERHQPDKENTMVMYETGTAGYGVQLAVVLSTKDEKIKAMTMVLPRKFVDDAKNGIFARDLAKSFLLAGVPDADAPSIKTLVDELQFGGQANWTETKASKVTNESTGTTTDNVTLTKPGGGALKKGDVAWMGVGPVPKLPEKPTPGYLAYLGKEPVFEKKYPHCRLRINNAETKGNNYVMFNVWVPGNE